MENPNDNLRIIVVQRPNGLLEAQMLELDIAVSAMTHEELLEELHHAIVSEYNLAVEVDRTPFVHLLAVPSRFEQMWDESAAQDGGRLRLPTHVAAALAAAIQFPNFTLLVKEFKRAA